MAQKVWVNMRDYDQVSNVPLLAVLSGEPDAAALVTGSLKYPSIFGIVRFYQADSGVIVYAEILGLPVSDTGADRVFGFHIHEGNVCTGDEKDSFSAAGSHYNPDLTLHPDHAGDMPPLFGNRDGFALLLFLTDRFRVDEIIGRTIIIHGSPDDFMTQLSGNAGEKIACGIIRSH